MTARSISEMSTENVKKNYKAMKRAIGILSALFIVLVALGTYVTIKKDIGFPLFLLFTSLPLFINNMGSFKKLKAERFAMPK